MFDEMKSMISDECYCVFGMGLLDGDSDDDGVFVRKKMVILVWGKGRWGRYDGLVVKIINYGCGSVVINI